MSAMFEVFYRRPRDPEREARLTEQVALFRGHLDCWEQSDSPANICLT
jgi:hypothetical protein